MSANTMSEVTEFNAHRDRLFAIAYRMLGSVHDAEDIVQEAWLRWSRLDREMVENPQALLCTMVTRMSIDALRSARRQRETYVGEWLPEPIAEDTPLPSEHAALAESLSTAFLLLLERLNPVERAALLLREVFGYGYDDIAVILEKSEANCRQIVRRAKERVRDPERRQAAAPEAHEQLFATFMEATMAGDVARLEALLASEATLHSDHGGKAHAAKRIIVGANKIARFFVGVTQRFWPEDAEVRICTLNGAPGVILYNGGVPETAFNVEIVDGQIQRVFVVRNPDKLERLPRP